jgi:hypothetical protein
MGTTERATLTQEGAELDPGAAVAYLRAHADEVLKQAAEG